MEGIMDGRDEGAIDGRVDGANDNLDEGATDERCGKRRAVAAAELVGGRFSSSSLTVRARSLLSIVNDLVMPEVL